MTFGRQQTVATDDFWSRFRRWRRGRPFWGGLFLLLSGVEMFLSANLDLGDMELHLGPQGFLSYLLPLIMLLTGALTWATPAQRLFYGIVGLLTALYSFLGLNLGGFILGMMLGIVGGALVIAWGPPRAKPAVDAWAGPAATAGPASTDPASPLDGTSGPDDTRHYDDTSYYDDDQIAGHDDRPTRPILRPADTDSGDTAIIPGLPPSAPDEPRGGMHPRALSVILLIVAVTGSVLIAGSNMPAKAVTCPEGLPSRSFSSAPASAPSAADPDSASSAPALKAGAPRAVAPTVTSQPAAGGASAPASPAPPSATTSAPAKSTNPVKDGVEDFFDGLGNLLGIGDDSTPSTSPEPSESGSAPVSAPATTTSAPATTPAAEPTTTAPSAAAPPSAPTTTEASSAAASAKPAASPSVEEIPCLGPRVMNKVAGADDIPQVSEKPGLMEVDSLTMYESTYDGVVDMPTAKGSFKALKFSMDKAVNKPFTLTIAEPGGAKTVIKSNELVTDKNVRFYTPKFEGKLFGLIPVTFTPEQPPPLTLPVLWFTDVTIQLAYVRCDTLTAAPLDIKETS
ncbi:DUF6114 domain-containing protein [Actinoplanes sp. NPDC000266]